jgi:hypothetical protein
MKSVKEYDELKGEGNETLGSNEIIRRRPDEEV